ncbi:MAG TPA: hypothetical protein VFO89_10980 [Thermoanaerobaculia bacterium]|nr:hypothetical protein [Thermoanaerobaculia bacterium]
MHDARIQVHAAILAAATLGRTLVPARPDDSHQSFTWSDAHGAFVQERIDGKLQPGVRLRDLTLLLIADGVQELPLRAPDAEDLAVLARLYESAAKILEGLRAKHDGASPVRLWPHHLDVAILIGSIGVGFLAGDDAIDEPYWYVYNSPMPEELPPLSSGEWYRGHWTGAVLKGDPDTATIGTFLDEAIAAVRR